MPVIPRTPRDEFWTADAVLYAKCSSCHRFVTWRPKRFEPQVKFATCCFLHYECSGISLEAGWVYRIKVGKVAGENVVSIFSKR